MRYTIKVQTNGIDTYPRNFKCTVHITDNETGKTYKRNGLGKFIGNFSPIWIHWQGKIIQIEELN